MNSASGLNNRTTYSAIDDHTCCPQNRLHYHPLSNSKIWLTLICMGVVPKRPTFFEKLISQHLKAEIFFLSVFLAKDLERGYKPHYSPYKLIVT
jgi:hypothetical protein